VKKAESLAKALVQNPFSCFASVNHHTLIPNSEVGLNVAATPSSPVARPGKSAAGKNATRPSQPPHGDGAAPLLSPGHFFGFMTNLIRLFLLAYINCVIGIIIFVLWSLYRFVNAHERVATALENIARKLRDGETKP
jgi:hypothetical protein